MDCLRIASTHAADLTVCCSRCYEDGPWDLIAGRAYCPNCQELLAQGEADAVVERVHRRPCAACSHVGATCYRTLPLNASYPVEIDLCGQHLRDLLARRLQPHAYHQLNRQLQSLGFQAEEVFLLHDAFYDTSGHALQPVVVE
jgi:hypothetical protein